MFVDIKFHW